MSTEVELFMPAQQFVRGVRDNPDMVAKLKSAQDPGPVLQEFAKQADEAMLNVPWGNDKWLYRFAVWVLGALALIAAIGAIVLVALNQKTPEVLISLGSAAVGALVGLFAPSPIANVGSK